MLFVGNVMMKNVVVNIQVLVTVVFATDRGNTRFTTDAIMSTTQFVKSVILKKT